MLPRYLTWPLALAAAVAALLVPAAEPAVASGDTYHVAVDGSGPERGVCVGGTEVAPWHDLENAMRCLRPGDTLIVHGGVYEQEVLPVTRSGRADAPITVRAAAGERPVIKGVLWLTSQTEEAKGVDSGFDHWTIDGIDVTRSASISDQFQWLVKFRGGRGWTFKNAEVWNAQGQSFAAVRVESPDERPSEPADWRIANSCIHDTGANHESGALPDHNVYVFTGREAGSGLFDHNVVFGAPNGANLKLGPGDTSDGTVDVTVRHNTFYDAAMANVLGVGQSRDLVVERNLMGRVSGPDQTGAVRGRELADGGNLVRENAGFDAPRLISNFTGSSFDPPGWVDAGANHFGSTPAFDDTTCDGFRSPLGNAYGHRAWMDRLSGSGRVQTGVALSRRAFADPAAVDAVVVSRSDTFPDALAGAPLAGQLDGPILLTPPAELHPATAAEIARLRPQTAYLLGGTAGLSAEVADEIEAMGVDVERLAGASRFDTARLAGLEVGGSEVFVVEGRNPDPSRGWPDAVSVSSLAALTGKPILLVERDRMPDATRRALGELDATRATIVGGTVAVSEEVAAEVADPDGDGVEDVEVERVAGPDRYATSTRVAERAEAAGAEGGTVWLATGLNWPDALAAGPAVAARGGVLTLVHGSDLDGSPATRDFLTERADTLEELVVVGGGAAVSGDVEAAVARALG